jgi:hypothetical protein
VLPLSFNALSDCLSSHDGFLYLLEPLYFLLDPDQFLLCCSFNSLSFLVPVLHLDLIKLRVAVDDLNREGALEGDWCGAPPLVWVELPAPTFWLEPAVVVDMLAGCSCTCRMVSMVGCSAPSTMVGKV